MSKISEMTRESWIMSTLSGWIGSPTAGGERLRCGKEKTGQHPAVRLAWLAHGIVSVYRKI